MARAARQRSETGIYHVMLRGVNRQSIFEEPADYRRFLEVIASCKEVGEFELYAYCLMGNHVHMLMRPTEHEPLELVFRRIGVCYVSWFNRKYDRVGHLFQGRYASEAIGDDSYFLSCLRYILRNPVAAGICSSPFDYRFSSAREYAGKATGPTDTALALDMIGRDCFAEFVNAECNRKHLDLDVAFRVTDADLRAVMLRETGRSDASSFQSLDRVRRNQVLAALRLAGGSIRQVSRLTGASEGVIRKFPKATTQGDGSFV